MGYINNIKDNIKLKCGSQVLRRLCYSVRIYRTILNKYRFGRKTQKEVFTAIYKKKIWGKGEITDRFYSGLGSHDENITNPYIDSVSAFLGQLGHVDVVDMGCGDFAIGSKLRPYCRKYIAADIVESLIVQNQENYRHLDVDFRVIDFTNDSLPSSDVILVRQVFQHMSNATIASALANISRKFKYLIITEHLPAAVKFPHNAEKSNGPDIRLYGRFPSGVVITSSPFNVEVHKIKTLCEVEVHTELISSVIKTVAYQIK